MKVSVILPTKNRAPLLADAVRAVLAQTVVPDEIIVVDQSLTDDGRRLIGRVMAGAPAPRGRPALVYIWDRAISGAAAARNTGLDLARGDIVVFLDDDVVPAPDVLARLLRHYETEPGLSAIAPVITNYARPGRLHTLHGRVFCRGPFRDERQPVYWRWREHAGALVPVRMFTGAMMSFRRAALGDLRHDPRYRAASVGEDIDLCWALGARGGRLAIATDAHVVHARAPRPAARVEEALLTSWAFLYDKHVPKTLLNRARFAWFVTGVVLAAVAAALAARARAPLDSALAGVRGIFSDYAGSRFLAPRDEARPRHAAVAPPRPPARTTARRG